MDPWVKLALMLQRDIGELSRLTVATAIAEVRAEFRLEGQEDTPEAVEPVARERLLGVVEQRRATADAHRPVGLHRR